ncbi:MAG: hypothetical protein JWQ50_6905 [Caballeronia mineralivorans]|jgi:hypothetical protein|nr:hypothetical protein [Caballeronia mineralivorans]
MCVRALLNDPLVDDDRLKGCKSCNCALTWLACVDVEARGGFWLAGVVDDSLPVTGIEGLLGELVRVMARSSHVGH